MRKERGRERERKRKREREREKGKGKEKGVMRAAGAPTRECPRLRAKRADIAGCE
jgi:ribosomal protein L19E